MSERSLISERSAVKRSISTTNANIKIKEGIKRNKMMNPLVMLLQRKVWEEQKEDKHGSRDLEGCDHSDISDDLIGSFCQSSTEGPKMEYNKCPERIERIPTPTYCQVDTDILGTLDINPVCGSPLSWSSYHHRRSSSCSLPKKFSFPISFSSSYTSWTKPLIGNKVSDSCAPSSSILDMVESSHRRTSVKRFGSRITKRSTSADTSKDIDDIDDLSLDELDDDELPEDDDEMTKLTLMTSSPDLAYISMGTGEGD